MDRGPGREQDREQDPGLPAAPRGEQRHLGARPADGEGPEARDRNRRPWAGGEAGLRLPSRASHGVVAVAGEPAHERGLDHARGPSVAARRTRVDGPAERAAQQRRRGPPHRRRQAVAARRRRARALRRARAPGAGPRGPVRVRSRARRCPGRPRRRGARTRSASAPRPSRPASPRAVMRAPGPREPGQPGHPSAPERVGHVRRQGRPRGPRPSRGPRRAWSDRTAAARGREWPRRSAGRPQRRPAAPRAARPQRGGGWRRGCPAHVRRTARPGRVAPPAPPSGRGWPAPQSASSSTSPPPSPARTAPAPPPIGRQRAGSRSSVPGGRGGPRGTRTPSPGTPARRRIDALRATRWRRRARRGPGGSGPGNGR